MKLKLILDNLDGLDEALHTLYSEKDGKFHLDVDGLPDVTGLKKKADELLAEKKALQESQKQEIANAVEAALTEAKKTGDTDALEKSWQAKYDAKELEMQGTIDSLQTTVTGLTSGSEATKLAAALAVAGSADALLPHITRRLRTEMKDGVAKTIVLDSEGKASAATIEELTAEIKANPVFAPLIAGTKGNGKGTKQPGQNQPGADENTSELSPTERINKEREAQAAA